MKKVRVYLCICNSITASVGNQSECRNARSYGRSEAVLTQVQHVLAVTATNCEVRSRLEILPPCTKTQNISFDMP